jgi:acyl-coenzyme A thioesterase PaaI-like protein
MTDPAMDIPALHAFLTREFPQVEGVFRIEELRADGVRVRMPVTDANLRPGGTVSGPSMFALADVAL